MKGIMRKKLFIGICAACAVLAAQAQTSSGTASGSSSTQSGDIKTKDYNASSSSQGLSATGRSGQHEVRASKLMGATVNGSSGEQVGKIEDVIINPASGRIDFAVIAYNSTGSEGSATLGTPGASGTAATPGTTTGASANSSSSLNSTISTPSSGEKLVAVPWTLIRPSGMVGYSASTTSTPGNDQQTFVFTGDKTKLQGAPSFDRNNWPDLNQADWRHNIYSHYGIQSNSASGGASSPGGFGSGTRGTSSDNNSKPSDSTAPKSSGSPGEPQK